MENKALFRRVVENKSQVLKFLGFNENRPAPGIISKKVDEELSKFAELADIEYHYNIFETENCTYADVLYSVGRRLEDRINEYLAIPEAMRAMILDKIGVVLLDEIKDQLIQDIYYHNNYYVIEEKYPGETKNFPIEKQKEIFDNIKGKSNITINEYHQLNPVKSVAIRFVLGKKPEFVNKCNNCSVRCDGYMTDEEAMYKFFIQKAKIYTKEIYRQKNILDLYDDNIKDISIWAKDYFNKTEKVGIARANFNWIDSILELKVIKLGELQFELTDKIEIGADAKDAIFVNVHIREGIDFSPEKCEQAYENAIEYFKKDYKFKRAVFLCNSWLTNRKLKNILPENSNIIRFQEKYTQISINDEVKQAEERVFGVVLQDKEQYPQDSSLRRNLRRELLKGEKYGMALSYFIKEVY